MPASEGGARSFRDGESGYEVWAEEKEHSMMPWDEDMMRGYGMGPGYRGMA